VSEDFTALLRNARRGRDPAPSPATRARRGAGADPLARDRAEAMLREVNHRVGNSLQLVSSFMSLQLRHLADEGARAALKESQARIEAVAHVHRRLYTSGDMSSVAMDEYLEGLIDELGKSLGPGDVSPNLVA
jgi:two-component sensor histidine kinase